MRKKLTQLKQALGLRQDVAPTHEAVVELRESGFERATIIQVFRLVFRLVLRALRGGGSPELIAIGAMLVGRLHQERLDKPGRRERADLAEKGFLDRDLVDDESTSALARVKFMLFRMIGRYLAQATPEKDDRVAGLGLSASLAGRLAVEILEPVARAIADQGLVAPEKVDDGLALLKVRVESWVRELAGEPRGYVDDADLDRAAFAENVETVREALETASEDFDREFVDDRALDRSQVKAALEALERLAPGGEA